MFKKVIFTTLLVLTCLTGCAFNTPATPNTETTAWNLDNGELLAYDHFSQKFVKYNAIKNTGLPIEPYTGTGIIQYAFNTPSSYYTSGDSYNNHFSILEYNEGNITEVYKLEDEVNSAIFPLATDELNYFFIKANYADVNKTESVIVKYSDNQLYEYTHTNGAILSGALIDNILYYISYNYATSTYTLYALNISDYNNKPNIIKTGLVSSQIVVLNGQVYCTNNDTIYSDTDEFEKKSINLSDPVSNTLIQINASADLSQLQLTITDGKSKEILASVDNIIGIDLKKSLLTIYTQGAIKVIDLQQLKNKN